MRVDSWRSPLSGRLRLPSVGSNSRIDGGGWNRSRVQGPVNSLPWAGRRCVRRLQMANTDRGETNSAIRTSLRTPLRTGHGRSLRFGKHRKRKPPNPTCPGAMSLTRQEQPRKEGSTALDRMVRRQSTARSSSSGQGRSWRAGSTSLGRSGSQVGPIQPGGSGREPYGWHCSKLGGEEGR